MRKGKGTGATINGVNSKVSSTVVCQRLSAGSHTYVHRSFVTLESAKLLEHANERRWQRVRRTQS